MAISPARRAAFDVLWRVESEEAYSSALLAAVDDRLSSKDRGLMHELVLGVLRRRLWLDRYVEHFSGRSTLKLDLPVLIALRLGLYQIQFLSRIPAAAAVNESVNLIRAAKVSSAASFANAVLRRATRELDYDPAASIDDPVEKLAVQSSHPRWLLDRWIQQMGFDEASALANANNDPAPLAFRFTARAANQAEDLIDQLRAGGAELKRSTIARHGWRVLRSEGADFPAQLLRELSADGLIYFQDEASQLVAESIVAQRNDRVLDVCAAPGSKTTLIAALSAGATIIAGDLHEHRVRTIQQFAEQQLAETVEPVTYDATQRLPFVAGTFDHVLVDAPCSGTGTLRHNPEIRWRLQPTDIAELAEKQRCILRNAAEMVTPGGTLIYSTCSVEIEENEAITEDFRQAHPEFEPAGLNNSTVQNGQQAKARTWPQRDDVDGFFIARFERKK